MSSPRTTPTLNSVIDKTLAGQLEVDDVTGILEENSDACRSEIDLWEKAVENHSSNKITADELARTQIRLSVVYLAQNKPIKAVSCVDALASHNNSEALLVMGWAHRSSRMAAGRESLRKAMELGNATAIYECAVILGQDDWFLSCPDVKNAEKIAELYQQAESKSVTLAQERLGHLYEQGKGVKKDVIKAAEYYRKSCENGHGFQRMNDLDSSIPEVLYHQALVLKKCVSFVPVSESVPAPAENNMFFKPDNKIYLEPEGKEAIKCSFQGEQWGHLVSRRITTKEMPLLEGKITSPLDHDNVGPLFLDILRIVPDKTSVMKSLLERIDGFNALAIKQPDLFDALSMENDWDQASALLTADVRKAVEERQQKKLVQQRQALGGYLFSDLVDLTFGYMVNRKDIQKIATIEIEGQEEISEAKTMNKK